MLTVEEISYRLIQILRKVISPNESVERFTKVKKPTSETLKDIIFEISSKIDDLQIEMRKAHHNASYLSAQTSQFDVQIRDNSNGSSDNRSQFGLRNDSPMAHS